LAVAKPLAKVRNAPARTSPSGALRSARQIPIAPAHGRGYAGLGLIRQSKIGDDPCGEEYGEPQEPAVGLDRERATDGGKGE